MTPPYNGVWKSGEIATPVCATSRNDPIIFNFKQIPGVINTPGRFYYSCARMYCFTFSNLLCFHRPSSAFLEKGTMILKSMWAPSK